MSEVTLQLRDVLGRTLALTDPFLVKEWDGFGPSPVSHISEVGVFQNGETFRDARREARTLLIALDVVAESRTELWQRRGELTRMLAWLTGGCWVTVTLPDGTTREILARYVGQADMGRKTGDGPVRQRVVLNLRCEDPAFVDPAAVLWVYNVGVGASAWGFPLGFDAGFGPSTIDVGETKEYVGDLAAHPVVTIIGPADGFILENLSTDEQLDFAAKAYNIQAEETVTIDTRPGRKSVTSSINGNILAYLSDDSDLGTFHVAPDPEAPGGLNTIRLELDNATGSTRVQLQFYVRYDGAHL